jgi:hypothetical protein
MIEDCPSQFLPLDSGRAATLLLPDVDVHQLAAGKLHRQNLAPVFQPDDIEVFSCFCD